ncbi:hypothetical protein LTS17_008242 [Exophiala oligosperma]
MAVFDPSGLTPDSLVSLGLWTLGSAVVSSLIFCIYNLWLHPLSKFPGPKIAAIAPFWAMRHWLSGDNLWRIKELHQRYGPVVRISPNQLSFCSSASWKDIHGHKPGSAHHKTFLKGSFYEPFPEDLHQIVSESDPGRHAAMRKSLSHGFSASALGSQEDRVQYFVNLLITQIGRRYTRAPGDMSKWYNYATFDVIGELAFGESHYWIDILFASIKNMNFMRSFEYSPFLRSILRAALDMKLLPARVYALRAKMNNYASEKLTQ